MSLYSILYNIVMKCKKSSQHLIHGREVILGWTEQVLSQTDKPLNILDIGCGKAEELTYLKDKYSHKVNLYALENYEPYRVECVKKVITPSDINIEKDQFPFKDEFFDIIIINQVIEHCKELYYIFSEISRILKKAATSWWECPIWQHGMTDWLCFLESLEAERFRSKVVSWDSKNSPRETC